MIVISGRMRFDPAQRAHALAEIAPVVAATAAEEGNIHYRYYADLEDPNVLLLFEEWRDDEALQAHFSQPYVLSFLEKLPTLGMVEASVHRYDVSSKSLMG
jgi:quinol monooxygenase YgiN